MAIREIIKVPHPTLRQNARKVTDFGPKLQTLIDDMVETMRTAPGVGLAAPQVDVPLRLIVIEYNDDEEDEAATPKLYAIANPEIHRPSAEKVIGTEGCLSIPALVGNVERHAAVTIKGQNRRGQPVKIKTEGWLARIFQHEIDHLDGVLYTDRASEVWQPEYEPAQVMPAD